MMNCNFLRRLVKSVVSARKASPPEPEPFHRAEVTTAKEYLALCDREKRGEILIDTVESKSNGAWTFHFKDLRESHKHNPIPAK